MKSSLTNFVTVMVALCLIVPVGVEAAVQCSTQTSRYVKPAVYDGLFYVVSDDSRTTELRALVLSYNDAPIPPKENDPGAPTIPGFYPSQEKRFDFERVQVIRRKVYFRTRTVDGIRYEFSGTSGQAIVPNFDPSILVPFIKGTLTTFRNGKRIKRERIKFGHAVIA